MNNKLNVWYQYFKTVFGFELINYQLKIVEKILSEKHPRLHIMSCTRAGKSFVVAMTSIVYALLNPNSKVYIISATTKQASIIMEYVYDFITKSSFLARHTLLSADNMKERMGKRMKFDHLTFRNDASIRILSGEGKGERLLGHGVGDNGLVIVDESPLILDNTFYGRIMRMLGDNPEAQLVEIGNPIALNHFYDNYNSEDFEKVKVTWEDCVKAGRLSQSFIDEQRKMLSNAQFSVLYDAEFVDEVVRYYPRSLIKSSINKWHNYNYKELNRENVKVGIDFGRTRDLTVISIIIIREGKEYQTEAIPLLGKPFPEQREIIEDVFNSLNYNGCYWEARLDMTGMGWSITEELQSKYGKQVIGLDFTRKLRLPVLERYTKQVHEVLALNMRNLMQDNKLYILNNDELISDFENFPEDMQMERTERGHFDYWIATGLSTLPRNFSTAQSEMAVGKANYFEQKSTLVNRYLRNRNK